MGSPVAEPKNPLGQRDPESEMLQQDLVSPLSAAPLLSGVPGWVLAHSQPVSNPHSHQPGNLDHGQYPEPITEARETGL